MVAQRLGDDGGWDLQDEQAQCGGPAGQGGDAEIGTSWLRWLACSGWPARRPGYGAPDDVLELKEVDKPVAADNQVLVRVHAAAVNAHDWHIMRGDPYLARLLNASWES